MTDEEIVKALAWNAKHYEKMGYIDTSTGNVIVKSVKYQEVIDLIHRLQSKYRNLEINYNGMYEHYRELSLEEPKLKAEIERLTEENKRLKEAVKETARAIFEKIFEVLCCFTAQGKSKEYSEGYIDCLEEVDKRLQSLAKEKYGVEVE